jgi:anaerobic magnesium-protoporphyrin IX monomethyl ester cyclase
VTGFNQVSRHMDILLTHGYFLFEDSKERAIMKPYAPLGLLYLSSYLRKKGFEVEIYDTTFGSRKELFNILEAGPPSVIGIYGNLLTRCNVLEIISTARETGWKVILGGPEPAGYAEEYLEAGADFIVQGEGEVTTEELLNALKAGDNQSLLKISGLLFRGENGSLVRTAARPLIRDLDGQPWPDRERIDIDLYVKTWRDHHGMGSLSLITARGCPYRCRWCSHSIYGHTHRRRSPEGVADEAEWLLSRYEPDRFWIADDVFTIHHGWILRYAGEMKRRRVHVPFECITRADRITPRIADALSELGCFRVWIGSESGSQRILDAMERGVKVEQVRDAIRLCRERRIQTGMFLMWGYEDEQVSDIEATVEHVKAAQPDVFLTTVSYPIKGTPYYEEVASRLSGPTDWARSTDRDLVIRGRRSREFFDCADRLLKSEVALHKLMDSARRESVVALSLRREIEQARSGLYAMSARGDS